MNLIETDIEDLFVLELKIFQDNRGFFTERFNQDKWKKFFPNIDFVQDNHSRSKSNVIRGMHMQNYPPQSKLVGVTRGSIIDIVVDLRKDSKTYKKSFSIELSDSNGKLLFVPAGFIHGFYVNSKIDTDVFYKVSSLYNPKEEISIKWNDPDLKLKWPNYQPIISSRDDSAMSFKEYENNIMKRENAI